MTQSSRRSFLAALASAHVTAGTAVSRRLPRWTPDGLQFVLDGVRLDKGKPSATLLVGSAERRITIAQMTLQNVTAGRVITPAGELRERTWCWVDNSGFVLSWTLGRLLGTEGFVLGAAVRNGTAEAVRLRDIILCDTGEDAVSCSGDPAGWSLSTAGSSLRVGDLKQTLAPMNDPRWSGYGGDCLAAPGCAADGRWRTYTDLLTLYTDKGRKGLLFSAAGNPRAHLRFDCRVSSGRLRLIVTSEMSDLLLEPGETREAQDLVILSGPYDDAMDRATRWLAATHGARTSRGPLTGWCSWYDKLDKITAADVNLVSQEIAKARDRFPIRVIQIDDGFQREWGDWRTNNKFPGGWAPVIANIRAAGAMAGIWLAPLCVRNNALGMVDADPEWFQKNAAGRLLGKPAERWLDPTHPGAQEFLRQTIHHARAAGFEYFKIDYNEVHSNCRFQDARKTRLEVFRNLYKLYREEIGEHYLSACAGFTRGVMGYADSARIGWDSRARWDFKPGQAPICIHECIRCVGRTAAANGIFFANDPDVTYLKTRDILTPVELETWHGFVGLLGGAMMISEPLHQPEYRNASRLFEILCPPAPDRARPLNPADLDFQQFGFMARRPWGDFATVLVWNASESSQAIRLESPKWLAALGEAFHVWSFWDGAYRGMGRKNFITTLAPHASAVLRLTPAGLPGVPLLVGSDLHISMGSAEIAALAATPGRLAIRLRNAGARQGSLWVHSAKALEMATTVGCRATVQAAGSNLWRIRITERERSPEQSIFLHTAG